MDATATYPGRYTPISSSRYVYSSSFYLGQGACLKTRGALNFDIIKSCFLQLTSLPTPSFPALRWQTVSTVGGYEEHEGRNACSESRRRHHRWGSRGPITECLGGLAEEEIGGDSFNIASCSANALVASALHSAWRCASAVGNPNCHAHSQDTPPTLLCIG